MTATRASAQPTTVDRNNRSLAAFVLGLVAFISGFTMLFIGAVPPDLQSHPVAVLAAAANRVDPAPVFSPLDAARAAGGPRLLTASNEPRSAVRGGGATMTHDDLAAGQISAVHPDPDIRAGSPRPSPCLKTDLELGTRAESAQLATIPLQRDPREALIMLAAAQHGGPGIWSGPCLMRRLTVQDSVQADSDDRIANALVAPAPVASPQRLTGPR
jgi:hypothetical protein